MNASSSNYFYAWATVALVGTLAERLAEPGMKGSMDRLGLDVVYLQAKRWDSTVGRPEVQKFVGALHSKRARKGVFITTGNFSSEAVEFVSHIDSKIVLIDGRQLADLMIDFNLGVALDATYELKRIDTDFFAEE